MTRARTLADIGDLSAPLTVTTAAQPNITSLGTLTGLTVGSSSAGIFNLQGGSSTSSQVRFFDGGTGRARVGVPTGQTYLSLSGSDSLTADVAITSGGNVGIGTTAVNRGQLQIASADNVELHLTGSGQTGSGDGMTITANSSEGNIWLRENGYFRIATNGSERMRIDAAGNVGVHVTPSGWSGDNGVVQVGNSSLATFGNGTYINSNAYFDGSNNRYIASDEASRYYQVSGQHIWQTAASGTASNAITFSESMRIDASGNLLIGISSYDGSHFNDTSGGGFAVTSAGKIDMKVDGTVANFNRTNSSDGDILYFAKGGTGVGSIGSLSGRMYVGSGDVGVFFDKTNNMITPYSIDAGDTIDNHIDLGYSSRRFKNLFLSGGAYIGGTGSANYLDDYEEGTYTPVLASSGCTFSYSVQLGSYVKIGNFVYLQFNITLSNRTGTLTNTVFMDNVPFNTKNVNNSLYSGGHIGHYFNINLNSGSTIAYQLPAVSTNQIELKEVGDNVGENSIVASELNTNATIRGSVMYRSV